MWSYILYLTCAIVKNSLYHTCATFWTIYGTFCSIHVPHFVPCMPQFVPHVYLRVVSHRRQESWDDLESKTLLNIEQGKACPCCCTYLHVVSVPYQRIGGMTHLPKGSRVLAAVPLSYHHSVNSILSGIVEEVPWMTNSPRLSWTWGYMKGALFEKCNLIYPLASISTKLALNEDMYAL